VRYCRLSRRGRRKSDVEAVTVAADAAGEDARTSGEAEVTVEGPTWAEGGGRARERRAVERARDGGAVQNAPEGLADAATAAKKVSGRVATP